MYYAEKLILSGGFLEFYKYAKIQNKGYTRQKIPRKLVSEQKELDFHKELKQKIKSMFSINRTRTIIRRIVNSNKDFTKFITLTFKENFSDIEKANRIFSKFIMRLKYKFPELKYLAVIEFQQRGAVHYHMVSNLPYIPNKKLQKLWGQGFIRINEIKHVTNLGAYVCKYLSKDMFDKRMFGQKKYFCSKNCIKPTEILDPNIIHDVLALYGIDEEKDATYKAEFDNEYTGMVKYKQFKI